MTSHVTGNQITLYGARIGTKGYRNFSGIETEYNAAGARNFVIFLDEDVARNIEAAGAPVIWKPDRYNEGSMRAQMKVHVKYYDRKGNPLIPPKVVLITHNGQTELDESTIGTLDRVDIAKADMIINMYANKGKMGPENSVALKTLYVTASEDELEAFYNGRANDESAETATW